MQHARGQVAALVGATSKEVVFTSSGTEANNLAILGAARAARRNGARAGIVTVATEHSSVIDSCRHLGRDGFRVTFLPVERDGLIDLNRLADAVANWTILVSVMAANNEIGALQPLEEIATIASSHGAPSHFEPLPLDSAMNICNRRLTIHNAFRGAPRRSGGYRHIWSIAQRMMQPMAGG